MSYPEKDFVQHKSEEIMKREWVKIGPNQWRRKKDVELNEGRPPALPISSSGDSSYLIIENRIMSSIFTKLAEWFLAKGRFKYIRWVFLIVSLWTVFTLSLRVYESRFDFWFYMDIFNLLNFYNFYWTFKAYKKNKG